MTREDTFGPVVTIEQAGDIIAGSLPWRPTDRTLRRWAQTGKAGGFVSHTTGQPLFRTATLKRTLKPASHPSRIEPVLRVRL